nr:MAG TPA: N-acetylmuramoyl-L-alanine amidase [Caudoviricetes sp.]
MDMDAIKNLLRAKRPSFYRYPEPVIVYLHWTAGHYGQDYPEYHFCIDEDGTITNTRNLEEIPAATYGRNEGSIAIALDAGYKAAAYKGDPYRVDLGEEAPTDDQIEAMAMLMAAISETFNIPIDIQHFMTHAEAADNMDGRNMTAPYGPATTCERWDLAVLSNDDDWMSGGDTLRGKAEYYKEQDENG